MSTLASLFVLVAAPVASAQTFKWSFTAGSSPEWSSWATDGHGSLAVIGYYVSATGPDVVRTEWIDAAGRRILTNDVALGDSTAFRIVRCNRTELAVLIELSFEHAPGTNFLRRFKRNGTFKDTLMPVGETMDAASSLLVDDRGFFTRSNATFRRYSN